jgi:hypothetical protein
VIVKACKAGGLPQQALAARLARRRHGPAALPQRFEMTAFLARQCGNRTPRQTSGNGLRTAEMREHLFPSIHRAAGLGFVVSGSAEEPRSQISESFLGWRLSNSHTGSFLTMWRCEQSSKVWNPKWASASSRRRSSSSHPHSVAITPLSPSSLTIDCV